MLWITKVCLIYKVLWRIVAKVSPITIFFDSLLRIFQNLELKFDQNKKLDFLRCLEKIECQKFHDRLLISEENGKPQECRLVFDGVSSGLMAPWQAHSRLPPILCNKKTQAAVSVSKLSQSNKNTDFPEKHFVEDCCQPCLNN